MQDVKEINLGLGIISFTDLFCPNNEPHLP